MYEKEECLCLQYLIQIFAKRLAEKCRCGSAQILEFGKMLLDRKNSGGETNPNTRQDRHPHPW